MNINLQPKLLRVLQEGTVRRVGSTRERKVDVRVLSNINIPPEEALAAHKLRQDLYFRLGVVGIRIPPLRERKEDIPLWSKVSLPATISSWNGMSRLSIPTSLISLPITIGQAMCGNCSTPSNML